MLLYVTLLIFTLSECIKCVLFSVRDERIIIFWQKKEKCSYDSYDNFAYELINIHNFEYKLPKKII